MSKYTDQTTVEAYMQRSLTTAELVNLDDIIATLSNFISTYTSRLWRDIDDEDDTEDTIKLYDSKRRREIFIDDVISVTKLELLNSDGSLASEIASDDYILYPLNADYKNSIYLRERNFTCGRSRVRVTAKFVTGETLPAEIKMVASQLVAAYYANASSVNSGFNKESIEGYTYELKKGNEVDEQTSAILDNLRSWRKIVF